MIEELTQVINLFNLYSNSKMTLDTINIEYYRLNINGEEITTGDYEDILTRVKGINRERGFTHLGA